MDCQNLTFSGSNFIHISCFSCPSPWNPWALDPPLDKAFRNIQFVIYQWNDNLNSWFANSPIFHSRQKQLNWFLIPPIVLDSELWEAACTVSPVSPSKAGSMPLQFQRQKSCMQITFVLLHLLASLIMFWHVSKLGLLLWHMSLKVFFSLFFVTMNSCLLNPCHGGIQ